MKEFPTLLNDSSAYSFVRVSKMLGEIKKFFEVSRFIFLQYTKLLWNRDEKVCAFFTQIYRQMIAMQRAKPSRIGVNSVLSEPLSEILPIKSILDLLPFSLDTVFTIQVDNDVETLLSPHLSTSNSQLFALEQVFLNTLIRMLRPKQIFEFGTCFGGTTYNLYLNSGEECHIATMDICPRPIHRSCVASMFENERVNRILADSMTYDFSSWEKRCDFIFVDASHEEDNVRWDTENALRMIRPGGTILWHDYCQDHPGVVRVLNDLSRKRKLFKIDRTCFALCTVEGVGE